MLTELLNKATFSLKNSLPFVLYSKPNDNLVRGIYQQDDTLHLSKDFTETGFVFAPFNLDEDIVLILKDELLSATVDLDTIESTLKNIDISVDESQYGTYHELIEKAITEIKDGVFKKVVLSRKVKINKQVATISLFEKVLKTYPKAFCYIWHHPKVGTWIGATPEILIKSKGTEFTTMSLAGTQSTIEFPEPKWTTKEIDEQQVVTNYITNTLSKFSITVEPSEVESIRAGNLWHLRTKLKGRFLIKDFGKLVGVIHPTPAVCGVPLKPAFDFIKENEQYDRSFYTGFLGELNFKKEIPRNQNRRNQENSAYKSIRNESELFVNLRCMQVLSESVSVYVGGGITAASIPRLEWEETVNKSMTMLKVLLG